MAISKTLDVNTLDIDRDGTSDHLTFHVTQTGEQSFSVRTFVDTSENGFGKLDSDTTKKFTIDTLPQWQLSSLKFDTIKLVLLGQDGTSEKLSLSQLIPGTEDRTSEQSHQLDDAVAENAGVLGALRDTSILDSSLGNTGLNSEMMNGIGGLKGAKGTIMASGGIGSRGELGGGGTAEDLGGLGTKGRGAGVSGYDSGLGSITPEPIILGAMDKSLIDAVIKRNMGQIRYVYQRELADHPDLAGKVTIKFVIANDGTVSKAEVKKIDDKEMSSWNDTETGARVNSAICGRFMGFQFPEPKGGGILIVDYPFIFNP